MGKGIGGHHRAYRGKTDDWLTPPHIIEALGPFYLDPCASVGQVEGRPWRTASRMIALPENGLDVEWSGRVWLNPPYGSQTFVWLDRLAEHGFGTALTFARTETRGFFESVWSKAVGMLFLRGRLHFCHPITGERAQHNSGGPSVLVAYSWYDFHRLADSRLSGRLVCLQGSRDVGVVQGR